MRYFLTLAYRGTHYNGWQIQPNAPSVQGVIQKALTTLLRHPVEVVGCGRTDTGVHARYYVAHFDTEAELPATFLPNINGLLPYDIAVQAVRPVAKEAHARFDAYQRSYEYHIALQKDPFARETSWFLPQNDRLDLGKMQQVADLLPRYASFFPFCKTHSGLDVYTSTIIRAAWEYQPDLHRLIFHIAANRFLRGMVRLIVGASVNVGFGKITLDDVKTALDAQQILQKSLSVPPEGLFLTDVKYPRT